MGKVSAQTEITAATLDDLLYLVNDPSGTPASRKIALGNILASINSFTEPDSPYCLDFNGSDNTVTLSAAPAVTGTAYTYSWWCKLDATVSNDAIFGKTGDSNAFVNFSTTAQLDHKCDSSGVNYARWAVSSVSALKSHFVLRRNGDGNDFDLFQNGVAVAAPTYSGTLPNNGFTPTIIGDTNAGAVKANGLIWGIKAWNRALTDDECVQVYNNVKVPTSLVFDMPLSDGTGTTVYDRAATITGTVNGTTTSIWDRPRPVI